MASPPAPQRHETYARRTQPVIHDFTTWNHSRMTTSHITSNVKYLSNRKCCAGVFKSFGTIDWREGPDCSRTESSSNSACRSDLPIAIFDDPNNRGQETAPTREHKRPQSHDTPCLWERSPDRDFRNGPCRKSEQDESLWRRVRCAPEALPIIVESRLTTLA